MRLTMTAPAPAQPAPLDPGAVAESALRRALSRVKGKLAGMADSDAPRPKIDPKRTRMAVRAWSQALDDTTEVRIPETLRLSRSQLEQSGEGQLDELEADAELELETKGGEV